MRAFTIESFGGLDRLLPTDLPRPEPGPGEVLVRTVAAGVNPADLQLIAGRFRDDFPHRYPLVPGWDLAGVIESLGQGATRFRKGESVWAAARANASSGCYAEYVRLPEKLVAPMPRKLLHEEAAATPVAGTAALLAIERFPALGARHNLLIHGVAGGVGHFAAQLGRQSGARTLGTMLPTDLDTVGPLGISAGIDATRADWVAAVREHCPDGVDLLIDTVGGRLLHGCYDALREGGRVVSLVETPDGEELAKRGLSGDFLAVESDGADLERLGQIVDLNRLRPNVDRIYPFARAREALEHLQAGGVRGKLVLNL